MSAGFAQLRPVHYGGQGRLDRPMGIGQEIGGTGQGFVGFRIEDMQGRADKQAMVFSQWLRLSRAFRNVQNIGGILHVSDFPLTLPHLQ